jgi:hypothetical protein
LSRFGGVFSLPLVPFSFGEHGGAATRALGQKRTCAVQKGMSALPPKADIPQGDCNVC